MCGIAGVMNTDKGNVIDAQMLVNMAAIQHHRGPDGFGYQVLKQSGVGFSHARLSIIDLDEQRARQPFLSDDKNILLAHNGEFYDYQKIRARLTAEGARFQTKSDSEIIMHLYPRQGMSRALHHLRGEFAFALYDNKEESLFLVRDRFGIKPLYWTQTDNGVVFGSELKVLFANPDVQRKFSATGIYHQLMQIMVPGTTAFEGIHQVKPGHVVRIKRNNGKLEVLDKKYWDINFPEAGTHEYTNEDMAIDAVREKLLEAVVHRLEADVPVGSYLSGGIDSCAILGLAAASRQQPVKAFTIGFDDKKYDESHIATEMAESCSADQDIMRLTGNELYGHFEETLWHTERTIYNTLGVAKLLMSRHVNENNYKVVLTGEGSDELFAGYPSFRRDMFLYGLDDLASDEREQWHKLLNESNKLFTGSMLPADMTKALSFDKALGFTPTCIQPWLACSVHVPGLLSEEFRNETVDYDSGQAIFEQLDIEQMRGRHALDKAQYVWIKTMLEGQILTWGGDRVDMANSMEARPAFLDHHLAATAVQIPPNYRIKGKIEKYVLREAMKGLLPETLYKREKFAFMAPPAYTDKTKWKQMRSLADTYLSKSAIADSGLLSYEGTQAIFDRHDSPDISAAEQVQFDAIINHMLGVQILHKQFIKKDVPKQAADKAKELGWAA
ncbi:MAG: asparagine synthase (glutamine-hydrolyzing) [Proteobacteria bacterium]|nr:asparagine synthase (glutamine-hydrolyzing) [Pseudomonadota bacterium]NOG61422.1 asparagine synthase (glutamine-hydrolyzing) [Pseudomonadota bacterium]